VVVNGRHGDDGGVEAAEQRAVVAEGAGVEAGGDGAGLLEVDVGDAD
jgi:hypothetical protein